MFRNDCLFCSKQATNILKTIKFLLLMVQFHNAPSNLRTWPRGRQALAIRAHNLFQNNGKRNFFLQNWSDNDAKNNRKIRKFSGGII